MPVAVKNVAEIVSLIGIFQQPPSSRLINACVIEIQNDERT